MIAVMVTRIRKGARPGRLFIKEWMDYRGLSDTTVANRLEVARETVYRWRTQQHRLNPTKLAQLASALDCDPRDFWQPPSSPSLDAIMKRAPDDLKATAADILRSLIKRAS